MTVRFKPMVVFMLVMVILAAGVNRDGEYVGENDDQGSGVRRQLSKIYEKEVESGKQRYERMILKDLADSTCSISLRSVIGAKTGDFYFGWWCPTVGVYSVMRKDKDTMDNIWVRSITDRMMRVDVSKDETRVYALHGRGDLSFDPHTRYVVVFDANTGKVLRNFMHVRVTWKFRWVYFIALNSNPDDDKLLFAQSLSYENGAELVWGEANLLTGVVHEYRLNSVGWLWHHAYSAASNKVLMNYHGNGGFYCALLKMDANAPTFEKIYGYDCVVGTCDYDNPNSIRTYSIFDPDNTNVGYSILYYQKSSTETYIIFTKIIANSPENSQIHISLGYKSNDHHTYIQDGMAVKDGDLYSVALDYKTDEGNLMNLLFVYKGNEGGGVYENFKNCHSNSQVTNCNTAYKISDSLLNGASTPFWVASYSMLLIGGSTQDKSFLVKAEGADWLDKSNDWENLGSYFTERTTVSWPSSSLSFNFSATTKAHNLEVASLSYGSVRSDAFDEDMSYTQDVLPPLKLGGMDVSTIELQIEEGQVETK